MSTAAFLARAAGNFAVVGASTNRTKFGNKCLRCYLQHQLPVVGVNPGAAGADIEGVPSFVSLDEIEEIHAVTVVTPPQAALATVEQLIAKKVQHVWFQPGAESPEAVDKAREAGLNVISGGPCLLVELGFSSEF